MSIAIEVTTRLSGSGGDGEGDDDGVQLDPLLSESPLIFVCVSQLLWSCLALMRCLWIDAEPSVSATGGCGWKEEDVKIVSRNKVSSYNAS